MDSLGKKGAVPVRRIKLLRQITKQQEPLMRRVSQERVGRVGKTKALIGTGRRMA